MERHIENMAERMGYRRVRPKGHLRDSQSFYYPPIIPDNETTREEFYEFQAKMVKYCGNHYTYRKMGRMDKIRAK